MDGRFSLLPHMGRRRRTLFLWDFVPSPQDHRRKFIALAGGVWRQGQTVRNLSK